MKQTIRALSVAIYILWLIIIVFTVTAVYSATKLAEGVYFGQFETSTSGGTMTLLLPFAIDNKGLYDIADLNVTTILKEENGALLSNSSTVVDLIVSGRRVDREHNIAISIENMSSSSLSRLLFNDTDLSIEVILALRYALVIPLKISTNYTIPWGAPLHNLTIGSVTYNDTRMTAVVPLSFENHSLFSLNGTIRLEIWDTDDELIGTSTTPSINVSSKTPFQTDLEVPISPGYGTFKEVRLFFDISIFPPGYGPVVISLG